MITLKQLKCSFKFFLAHSSQPLSFCTFIFILFLMHTALLSLKSLGIHFPLSLSDSEPLRTEAENNDAQGLCRLLFISCSVAQQSTLEGLLLWIEQCSPGSLRIQWLVTTANPSSCLQLQNPHMTMMTLGNISFLLISNGKATQNL